jgi:hypothetical protein
VFGDGEDVSGELVAGEKFIGDGGQAELSEAQVK